MPDKTEIVHFHYAGVVTFRDEHIRSVVDAPSGERRASYAECVDWMNSRASEISRSIEHDISVFLDGRCNARVHIEFVYGSIEFSAVAVLTFIHDAFSEAALDGIKELVRTLIAGVVRGFAAEFLGHGIGRVDVINQRVASSGGYSIVASNNSLRMAYYSVAKSLFHRKLAVALLCGGTVLLGADADWLVTEHQHIASGQDIQEQRSEPSKSGSSISIIPIVIPITSSPVNSISMPAISLPLPPGKPDGASSNEEYYTAAIAKAAVKTPTAQIELRTIDKTQASVLVVSMQRSNPVENGKLIRDTWVALPDELRAKCRGKADALLAMQQTLGLPPDQNGKFNVVQFSVAPSALFRPCVGGQDIDKKECEFKANFGNERMKDFLFTQIWTSYRAGFDRSGHPFTGMGWSYDWSPTSVDHVGVSEFVAFKDAKVSEVAEITPDEFCNRAR